MAAIVGLPVELNTSPLRYVPFFTIFLCVVAATTFLITTGSGLNYYLQTYGFISSDPLRFFGLTVITSFFLHGGIFHLLGNLYYLAIFGDDAEDDLGAVSFLILVFGSHLSGLILQATLYGTNTIPLAGASAGVFDVIAYYMARFPRRKIGLEIFLAWLISQNGKSSGITHAAHVGGALFGFVLGYFSASGISREKPT